MESALSAESMKAAYDLVVGTKPIAAREIPGPRVDHQVRTTLRITMSL